MKYEDIAAQPDYHAAATQYVIETYGEQVALQLPDVADTVWQSILMGMPEQLCWISILSGHRLPPPNTETE
ncbi:hypothetical protein HX819_27730 [Pseudomonas sp. D6002]|uniref:hypothetical protein n=1 Tax=unclassified Pseudomonas TaxID=196821 RepID=UPI0015A4C1CC|nr:MULTISPECIES: hypothetical protein [unclassified Pseudomonas]NVZ95109.1 hypothetical protein [Pseudomonas sp. B6001]NWB18242.1 hypothetical protein [Pseudomonas sp. D6002]